MVAFGVVVIDDRINLCMTDELLLVVYNKYRVCGIYGQDLVQGLHIYLVVAFEQLSVVFLELLMRPSGLEVCINNVLLDNGCSEVEVYSEHGICIPDEQIQSCHRRCLDSDSHFRATF